MKKWVLCALAAVLVLSVALSVPFGAKAATYESGGFKYTTSGASATITGLSSGASGVVHIPETIEGYTVTTLGGYVFQSCPDLQGIVIPATVRVISVNAFRGNTLQSIAVDPDNPYFCNDKSGVLFNKEQTKLIAAPGQILDEIYTVPATVTSIDDYAFEGNQSLYALFTESAALTVGQMSFKGCQSLNTLAIKGSKVSLGYEAFYGCSKLSTVSFKPLLTAPEGAESDGVITVSAPIDVILDDWTFADCTNLGSIWFGNGKTRIGSYAFSGCTNMQQVYIYDLAGWCEMDFNSASANPLLYAQELYVNDQLVTDLVIPEGVTRIGSHCFDDFSGLTSVTIPDSVTEIGACAFQDCTSLTAVQIENGAISIGHDAFSDCRALTELIMGTGENNPDQKTTHVVTEPQEDTPYKLGMIQEKVSTTDIYWLTGERNGYYLDTTTNLGGSADIYMEKTTGGYYMYLYWGNSKTYINMVVSGKYVNGEFASKPSTVYVMDAATAAPKAYINGNYYWFGTRNDKTYTTVGPCYGGFNCQLYTDVDDEALTPAIGEYAFSGCCALESVVIPDGIQDIGARAFANCSGLTQLTIGSGVTAIGDGALDGCTALQNISVSQGNTQYATDARGVLYNKEMTQLLRAPAALTGSYQIPGTVTQVSDSAFSGCTGLTGVTVPDSVTQMGYYAFQNCTALKNVSLPGNMTEIPDGLFCCCDGLTRIEIPDSVNAIGSNAFSFCKALTDVRLGSGVTRIGSYAFERCSGLEQMVIPDSVTTIDRYAFYACNSLTDVAIGSGVTTIEEYAFEGCYNLGTVRISDLEAWCGISSESNSFGLSYYNNPLYYGCQLYLDGQLVQDLVIPDSVDFIIYGAFAGCESIESLTLPDHAITLGSGAFMSCSNLKSVYLPQEVFLNYDVFDNCYGLQHVAFGGSADQWNQIGMEDYNDLASVEYFHCESAFQWTSTCTDSHLYCPECALNIITRPIEGAEHSYVDGVCQQCGASKKVADVYICGWPDVLEYAQYTGQLDVTGGMLAVTYEDGTSAYIDMTADMVFGFDNTQAGSQLLTVVYDGFMMNFSVEILAEGPELEYVEMTQAPTRNQFLVGESLYNWGVCFTLYYSDGTTEQTYWDYEWNWDEVDAYSPGRKTVWFNCHGWSFDFEIQVHDANATLISPDQYPETDHPYENDRDQSWTISCPGADAIRLTFTADSALDMTDESAVSDYLILSGYRDGEFVNYESLIGQLGNWQVVLPGDSVEIHLNVDDTGNDYGFAFESIEALTTRHTYEQGECIVCGLGQAPVGGFVTDSFTGFGDLSAALGAGSGWLRLYADAQVELSLNEDLYVDLNGHTLTGTIITNGYKVYGMDKTTDSYQCNRIGLFACVDENGAPVVPQLQYRGDITGSQRRYLTLAVDGGYTFHRIYVGITDISLKPYQDALGYRAGFYADEMVMEYFDGCGYTMWLDGYSAKTYEKNEWYGNTLTLRLQNIFANDGATTGIYAQAFMRLIIDGEVLVLESSEYSTSMRETICAVNAAWKDYSREQKSAVKALLDGYPEVTGTWQLTNIYPVLPDFTTITQGKLHVAVAADMPPMIYEDGQEIAGLEIQVAQAIADKLGLELVVTNVGFGGVCDAVTSGTADMAMATYDGWDYYELDSTDVYLTESVALLLAEGMTPDDFLVTDAPVGVVAGTSAERVAPRQLDDPQRIITYACLGDLLSALADGEIGIACMDACDTWLLQYDLEGLGICVLEDWVSYADCTIGISPDSADLKAALNWAIDQLLSDGTIDAILEEYTRSHL